MAGLSALWFLAACADTEQYVAPPVEHDPVIPTYAEVMAYWETQLPASTFVDPIEEVPTDPDNPDYDNFIENQDFKTARVVMISWNGNKVEIDNPQANKGVEVTADGGYVVVRNLESEEGADDARGKMTYHLTGSSTEGQIKVYSNKKFQLVLDNLSLRCPNGPAVSIQQKKRCFVTLADGSVNHISDGEAYHSDSLAETAAVGLEDEKGCFFSEGQLIFGGNGSLMVTGSHQHGIASDEYVRIHPGCLIDVTAVKDAIHTKQQYQQSGSIVRCYALKDGLQSDSLGIHLTGGRLYLYGERPLTANGNGSVVVTPPAQTCLYQ